MKKTLFWIATVFVVLYLGVIVYFMANENSLVFHPNYTTRTVGMPPHELNVEEVHLQTEDGVKLYGWACTLDSAKDWIVFFHGNAGNVSDYDYPERYKSLNRMGLNVICVDYRGYGKSEGKPSEQGLAMDARAVYQFLRIEKGVLPNRIIVYGYSLGSGVATQLATEVPIKALILEGAFTSVPRVGYDRYPFLPLEWMARNKFENINKIPLIEAPKLFLHAADDKSILIHHSRTLYEVAKGRKQLIELKGGHDKALHVDSLKMYTAIHEFLNTH